MQVIGIVLHAIRHFSALFTSATVFSMRTSALTPHHSKSFSLKSLNSPRLNKTSNPPTLPPMTKDQQSKNLHKIAPLLSDLSTNPAATHFESNLEVHIRNVVSPPAAEHNRPIRPDQPSRDHKCLGSQSGGDRLCRCGRCGGLSYRSLGRVVESWSARRMDLVRGWSG